MTGFPTRFLLANLAALALTLVAVYQPWVEPTGEVPAAIARRYLPIALVMAALGTALVSRFLPWDRCRAFRLRHFAIYAVVPVLLFVQSRNVEPSPAVLGALYLAAVGLWTLHALEGLWHVVANLADRTAALVLAAVVLVPFFALYHQHFLDGARSLVLGGVIALAAPIGDLFESALKRDMDVKDSGRLLAAHGGMLDRLDALLFATVAAFYVFVAFGRA